MASKPEGQALVGQWISMEYHGGWCKGLVKDYDAQADRYLIDWETRAEDQQHLLTCSRATGSAYMMAVPPAGDYACKVAPKSMTPSSTFYMDMSVALEAGDVGRIRALVLEPADAERVLGNGDTPLCFATRHGQVGALHALHELGADVDGANEDDFTPLGLAAYTGQVEALHALHELGADVDRANKHGTTPLGHAAAKGHVGALRVLHELGADVEHADADGDTPLCIAAMHAEAEAVRALMRELGANPAPLTVNGDAKRLRCALKAQGLSDAGELDALCERLLGAAAEAAEAARPEPEPEGGLPKISKEGRLSILGMGLKVGWLTWAWGSWSTERAKLCSAVLQTVRSQGHAASVKELDLTGNDLT